MRAQLRTYHSIPCLQAHQDPNAYKQLQDAPRLKSILKGACEDPDQPNTIEKIQAAKIPRTNPVNLIFVLSQYVPKISEAHFFQPRDFFDLVIRSTLSSKSRAKAFLWLIWWYLESDFNNYHAKYNPFGSGLPGETPGSMNIKVPAFEHLTEEQANAENVDTEEEKAYGEMKRLERKRILEEDETVGPPMKKTAPRKFVYNFAQVRIAMFSELCMDRGLQSSPSYAVLWFAAATLPSNIYTYPSLPYPSFGSLLHTLQPATLVKPAMIANNVHTTEDKSFGSPGIRNGPSDIDRTRSPSPSAPSVGLPKASSRTSESRRLTGYRNENSPATTRPDFEKQQPITRLILKTSKMDHGHESSSPVPPGPGHPVFHPASSTSSHPRRPRPETSHQKAVNINRKMRIDSILHKKLTKVHSQVRRRKRQQTSTSVYTAMSRIIDLPENYDTEDEECWGPGGLVPNPGEEKDYGGEALKHKKVIDRVFRRLEREDQGARSAGSRDGLQNRDIKPEVNRKADSFKMRRLAHGKAKEETPGARNGEGRGRRSGQGDVLDDLDLDLLGEGREDDRAEDESNEDSGMDESEDGDENSEDGMMDTRLG